MTYTVAFTRRANAHLLALYHYITQQTTPFTAQRYTTALVSSCRALITFPARAPLRPEIFPGLCVAHHRGRTVIAYILDDARARVVILGLYSGGQDFESDLLENHNEVAGELHDALGDRS